MEKPRFSPYDGNKNLDGSAKREASIIVGQYMIMEIISPDLTTSLMATG